MKNKNVYKYPIKTRGLGQSPKKGATELAWESFYESWPLTLEQHNELPGAFTRKEYSEWIKKYGYKAGS